MHFCVIMHVQKHGINEKTLSIYLFPLYEPGYVDFLNKNMAKASISFQFFDI